jgi:hypothetical protein
MPHLQLTLPSCHHTESEISYETASSFPSKSQSSMQIQDVEKITLPRSYLCSRETYLQPKFQFMTHTKDTGMMETTATVTTLLPTVSTKKLNASENNHMYFTNLASFRAPSITKAQTWQHILLTIL